MVKHSCYFYHVKKYTAYVAYFLYWIAFFIVCKTLFLVYHLRLTNTLDRNEILKVFLYGLRMDGSFTGYICIFPFILFLLRKIFIHLQIKRLIKFYTYVIIILLSFLAIADLELYNAWGYRMDATPLQYLKTPKEMMTTVSSAPVFLLLLLFVLLAVIFIWLYKQLIQKYFVSNKISHSLLHIFFSVFLIALLFIPIRGGIQKIPLNQSDVYFSEKLYADHAAINLPWNIMFSILNRNNSKNPFDYLPEEKAQQLVNNLYAASSKKIPGILKTKRPNIIFIILESFTAKLVGCLGGEKGITPNLDSIAANGLLFNNIYAAGDRSEKGQVAVLSGYPNQAITSIIKTPTKTQKLPSITQSLKQQGYHTSYTYGGELEFANIKSYLRNIGFDKLIGKYSFPISERTTSWGVHDEYVLNHFFLNIKNEQQPFFAALFTLSSHEPYDVPFHKFKGTDETSLFENAAAYTDSCIGIFMNKLRKDSLWDNTLVVFVADHGHPLPGHDANDRPTKFHIPLIFSGGALNTKGIVTTIGSQTDIVKTVLDQLDIDTKNYPWSKDLLDSSAKQFAFYCFNNGFGFVTPKGVVTMDNVSKKIIYSKGNIDSSMINAGKAYMQFSYQDYLNR